MMLRACWAHLDLSIHHCKIFLKVSSLCPSALLLCWVPAVVFFLAQPCMPGPRQPLYPPHLFPHPSCCSHTGFLLPSSQPLWTFAHAIPFAGTWFIWLRAVHLICFQSVFICSAHFPAPGLLRLFCFRFPCSL